MENLKITDRHGDSAELIESPRHDGRVHLHVRFREDDLAHRCVHLEPVDQERMRAWLGQKLGVTSEAPPAQALQVYPSGPELRLTVGEGEGLREVVWSGARALPSVEMFEVAARLLLVGETVQDERREEGPSLYSEIVAGISQTLRAHDPESRGVPLPTRVVQLVQDLKDARSRADTFGEQLDRMAAERERWIAGREELRRLLDKARLRENVALNEARRAREELQQRMTEGRAQEERLIRARDEAAGMARAAREALELAEDTAKELRAALTEVAAIVTAHAEPKDAMAQQILAVAFKALEVTPDA